MLALLLFCLFKIETTCEKFTDFINTVILTHKKKNPRRFLEILIRSANRKTFFLIQSIQVKQFCPLGPNTQLNSTPVWLRRSQQFHLPSISSPILPENLGKKKNSITFPHLTGGRDQSLPRDGLCTGCHANSSRGRLMLSHCLMAREIYSVFLFLFKRFQCFHPLKVKSSSSVLAPAPCLAVQLCELVHTKPRRTALPTDWDTYL